MPSLTTAQPVKRIAALGDSLTAGYTLPLNQAYPAQLESALRKSGYPGVEVINAGINGTTTASGPARFEQLLRQKPDLLILALGANDALRGLSLARAKHNLARVIEMAQAHHLQVLLVGLRMPGLAAYYGPAYPQEFEGLYTDLARTFHVALVPNMLEGVAGHPELNLADGLHPNAAGQAIITQTLLNGLLLMLQTQPTAA